MANVGFIGLGIMGGPMALNLQKGGHQLFLHSRSGVKEKALLDGGGTECASPAEVAKQAEFILTMLPNTPDVTAQTLAALWSSTAAFCMMPITTGTTCHSGPKLKQPVAKCGRTW